MSGSQLHNQTSLPQLGCVLIRAWPAELTVLACWNVCRFPSAIARTLDTLEISQNAMVSRSKLQQAVSATGRATLKCQRALHEHGAESPDFFDSLMVKPRSPCPLHFSEAKPGSKYALGFGAVRQRLSLRRVLRGADSVRRHAWFGRARRSQRS